MYTYIYRERERQRDMNILTNYRKAIRQSVKVCPWTGWAVRIKEATYYLRQSQIRYHFDIISNIVYIYIYIYVYTYIYIYYYYSAGWRRRALAPVQLEYIIQLLHWICWVSQALQNFADWMNTCVYRYVCIYIYMYTNIHMCLYIHIIYIYIYTYINIYIYIHTCLYLYLYLYIYIYIYTHIHIYLCRTCTTLRTGWSQ